MNEKYYDILLSPTVIKFQPRNELEEIYQNIITICTTIKGSRPLDREFGISPLIVDEPIPAVTAKYNAEIISAINKYEPRAEVVKITWENFNEKLRPKIRIKIHRGN